MCNNKRAIMLGVAAVAAGMSGVAMGGVVVDLTTPGSSGFVRGALYMSVDTEGVGDPVSSFLRFRTDLTSPQGYNSSARPLRFNEDDQGDYTRNLRVSELPMFNIGGVDYFEFLFNANEPDGQGVDRVSINQMNIYTGPIGDKRTNSISSLGTLRYSLDATGDDNTIIVRDANSGENAMDARILVPVAMFGDASPDDYVYLFARIGDTATAQGSYEEFGVRVLPVVIPLPSAAGLGMAGLAGLAFRRRR
jgi:hypothetical protein